MKQSTTGYKNRFRQHRIYTYISHIYIQLSDNPGVPGMKDDEPRNRKRRPFHSEAGNIPRRTKYFKSKINTYWVRVGR